MYSKRIISCALGLSAVMLLGGCQRPAPTHAYRVLTGTVILCNAETGELTVLVTPGTRRRLHKDRVHCVLTEDSEVYVNDRFSSLHEVRVGDKVEIIGYREPDRRLESFVVGTASFQQPLPPPVVPEILREALAPTTAPTTQSTTDKTKPTNP